MSWLKDPLIPNQFEIETGSFRDRGNRIFYQENRIFRALDQDSYQQWEKLSQTRFFQNRIQDGTIIHSKYIAEKQFPNLMSILLAEEESIHILEHEAIPVISYPYEWSFNMLKDAALLHLNCLSQALQEGMTMKDASAYNIQWRGINPVIIDIPSFLAIEEGKPWMGYLQFCRMFLNPLLLQSLKNINFHPWMRGNIEGIEPSDLRKLLTFREYLQPGVFMHVVLHAQLQDSLSNPSIIRNTNQPAFNTQMIQKNIQSLTKMIQKLKWQNKKSLWIHYCQDNNYTDDAMQEKVSFIQHLVESQHWSTIWDMGSNTGVFSEIAAKNADYVLALESDHTTCDRLYQSVKEKNIKNILPLVYDFTNPSPGLGWRCVERKSLEQRSKPELILCLALVHHLVIKNNIPMDDIVQWLAGFQCPIAIEFIDKNDSQVQSMLCSKGDQYKDYEQGYFETCLAQHFTTSKKRTLSNQTRTLYFVTPK